MKSQIGAVIVSHRPHLPDIERTIAALVPQVGRLWVVDNGSGDAVVERLREVMAAVHGKLIAFPENRGIAAAHNAGLAAARAEGLDWVVLFDQDSIPAPSMVGELAECAKRLVTQGHRVAAVGARWMDQRSGRTGAFYRVRWGRIAGILPTDDAPVPVDFLISSGSLLSLSAVAQVGGMREDLFIDHVDTDWCARALAAGWELFGVPKAMLSHALGDSHQRVWLGRWREVAVHSPLRNYYEVRNTVALLRSPHVRAGWRVAHVTRLLQLLAFYALFTAPRRQRCRAMGQGLWDGLRGRMGRRDQS